jgi:hypothetical protein
VHSIEPTRMSAAITAKIAGTITGAIAGAIVTGAILRTPSCTTKGRPFHHPNA